MFSRDGRDWTAPKRVLEEGDWLWRVTWHDGKAYGVSYGNKGDNDPDWTLKLFVSADGVSYDLVTHLDVPGRPNETTLRVLPDGEMVALVRREAGDKFGWIGTSRPPYTRWSWAATKNGIGGPNFLRLPDGSLWAAGRSYPGGAKTVLARMTRENYEPVLTLPSGGDTSYPGLVWHDGLLWMSYYSSHEGKAAIYLAKVKVPLGAEPIGSIERGVAVVAGLHYALQREFSPAGAIRSTGTARHHGRSDGTDPLVPPAVPRPRAVGDPGRIPLPRCPRRRRRERPVSRRPHAPGHDLEWRPAADGRGPAALDG
jgi:hypothetical protein